MGGSTPEGGQGFHVRENLANERQKHAIPFYQAKKKGQPGAPEAVPALPVRRDVNDLKIVGPCCGEIAKP
jgi:hypothetical protein